MMSILFAIDFRRSRPQGQDLGIFVFGQGSATNAIRVEGESLCPLGELKDLLGEPFDAILFDEADRAELLKELGPSPVAEERDEPIQLSQTAPALDVNVKSHIRVGLFGPQRFGWEMKR